MPTTTINTKIKATDEFSVTAEAIITKSHQLEDAFKSLNNQVATLNKNTQETLKNFNAISGTKIKTSVGNSGSSSASKSGGSNNSGGLVGSYGGSNNSHIAKFLGGNSKTVNDAMANMKRAQSVVSTLSSSPSSLLPTLINLGSKAGPAGAAVALVVTALVGMTAAGAAASAKLASVENSMRMLGSSLGEEGKSAIEAQNKLVNLKKEWASMGLSIQKAFTPVFEFFLTAGLGIAKALGLKSDTTYQTAGPKAYTAQKAKQSGFTTSSAANLGEGTYSMASALGKQRGEDPVKIAQDLTDAFMSGSDAAAQYGIVVDDITVKGWLMQEKGIDAVNIQISEAAMQAHRYNFMQMQLSKGQSVAMQNQIKQWKQYGMLIDATKNQLLDFEQVTRLAGMDFTIPDIGSQNITSEVGKATDELENTPTNIPIGINLSPDFLKLGAFLAAIAMPLTVPVMIAMFGAQAVLEWVKSIPESLSVAVRIAVEGLPALQWARDAIAQLQGMMGLSGVTNPGMVGAQSSSLIGAANATRFEQPASVQMKQPAPYNAFGAALQADFALNKERGFGGTLGAIGTEVTTNPWAKAALATLVAVATGGIAAGVFGSASAAFSGAAAGGMGALTGILGHATGGLSTKEHIARISEGNSTEAIIPLDSSASLPAFQAIAAGINAQGGSSSTEVHVHMSGTNIWKDSAQMTEFAEIIKDKIQQIDRTNGNYNQGMVMG